MDNKKLYGKFSVPWNQCDDFEEKVLDKYEKYIESIYFTPPSEMKIQNFKEHYQELDYDNFYKQLSHIHGRYPHIKLNMLFNWFCMVNYLDDENIQKMVDIVRKMSFVDEVTVANLLLAEEFMRQLPDMRLHLSVRMDVDNYEKVAYLMEKYGSRIYCINLGRDCVYDLELFARLKKDFPNIKYKIIVNEFCSFQCMDSNLHSMMKAHDSYHRIERFQCASYDQENFWRFFTGQGILPRDIMLWEPYIDIFKCSGRWLSSEQLEYIMNAYTEMKDLSVGDIVFRVAQGGTRFKNSKAFCEHVNLEGKYPLSYTKERINCNQNCSECGYCKRIAKNYILKNK